MGCDDKNDWCEVRKKCDMYLFIKIGLKGRISDIAKRCDGANNKCMKNCDPTILSIYIPGYE